MQMFVSKAPVGMEIITLILDRIKFVYRISAEILPQTIVLWKIWSFSDISFIGTFLGL